MHIPKRMCIACRSMKEKGELVKIVKTPDGAEIDINQNKFGRGAYVCKDGECIKNLAKRRTLSKHFKMQIDNKIYDEILNLDNLGVH